MLINTLLGYFNELWDRWSRDHDIDSEFIRYLLPDEIIKLFADEKVDIEQIRERKQLIFIGRPEEFIVYGGDVADNFRIKYLQLDQSLPLKGRVAARGIARGTVKIVLGQSDFAKFEKGNVLSCQ